MKISPERWAEQPNHVERNTRLLLDRLDRAGVRGTFFTLGWVAERHPSLVREIGARGHEVASHGHEHRLAFQIGPKAFRDDADRSKALEGVPLGRLGLPAEVAATIEFLLSEEAAYITGQLIHIDGGLTL